MLRVILSVVLLAVVLLLCHLALLCLAQQLLIAVLIRQRCLHSVVSGGVLLNQHQHYRQLMAMQRPSNQTKPLRQHSNNQRRQHQKKRQ